MYIKVDSTEETAVRPLSLSWTVSLNVENCLSEIFMSLVIFPAWKLQQFHVPYPFFHVSEPCQQGSQYLVPHETFKYKQKPAEADLRQTCKDNEHDIQLWLLDGNEEECPHDDNMGNLWLGFQNLPGVSLYIYVVWSRQIHDTDVLEVHCHFW